MNAESEDNQNILIESKNAICRFCGGTENDSRLIGIYSDEGLENDIPKKIEMHLPHELSESVGLPMDGCWGCISTIIAWHKFVQKALETTRRLTSFNEELIVKDMKTSQAEDKSFPNSKSLYSFYPNHDERVLKYPTSQKNLQTQKSEEVEENDNYDDVSYYADQKEDKESVKIGQEQNSEDLSFVCHFCPEVFLSEDEVLNHTNDTHPDASENEESQKKTRNNKRRIRTKIDPKVINQAKVIVDDRVYYNCKECGKSLLSPYTYIWHMRIHTGERPFVCDLCGKQFRVSQGLVRHLKETHERIKNFSCDLCGRMFATKRNVDEHRRIHTNERPYICALCGKAFKQKASLFVHNRTHSDSFPFKCEHCNQGFRTKPPLLIHVTKHTGQKPYACDVCGRCFRIKYELKRHKLVHSEEKPYACSFCGLRFKQKRYLRNHFKANHSNNYQQDQQDTMLVETDVTRSFVNCT